MTDTPKPTWSYIRKQLLYIGKDELIALVKDLYALSPQNKRFMEARFAPRGEQAVSILDDYKQQIVYCFFGKRDLPTDAPRLKDARKLIRDYRKATNDALGALDLMLHYVETGTQYTNNLADISEPFYNSLESVLYDFKQELVNLPDPQSVYDLFTGRLSALRKATYHIGWGYGDEVGSVLDDLAEFFGEK
jgi:hypothetical protein